MTTNTISLTPRRDRGWMMGLANMLAKENVAWWHTRRWWIQCLIAMAILNGCFAMNMQGSGRSLQNAGLNFLIVGAIASSVGRLPRSIHHAIRMNPASSTSTASKPRLIHLIIWFPLNPFPRFRMRLAHVSPRHGNA